MDSCLKIWTQALRVPENRQQHPLWQQLTYVIERNDIQDTRLQFKTGSERIG
jgi:hypothetical protein